MLLFRNPFIQGLLIAVGLLSSILHLTSGFLPNSFVQIRPQTAHKNQIHFLQTSKLVGTSGRNTKLHLVPATTATTTLILSSTIGTVIDRKGILGGNSGSLVTLITAAILSNIGFAPSSHVFYDVCWSHFLPASLTLMLLSASSISSDDEGDLITNIGDSNVQDKGRSQSSPPLFITEKNQRGFETWKTISAVSVPFAIGSVGSIIGCALSAFFVTGTFMGSCGSGVALCNARSISKWIGGMWSCIRISSVEAAMAAGCLCSSYIGGSVNFFSTARILTSQMQKMDVNMNMNMSTLLTSMAAADVFVMALYFGGLSAAMSWKRLRNWFPGRRGHDVGVNDTQQLSDRTQDRREGKNDSTITAAQTEISIGNKRRMLLSTFFASSLAWAIVELSILFEKCTSSIMPGLGCASIAIMATVSSSIATRLAKKNIQIMNWFATDIAKVGPVLSEMSFYLFFAAIGTSANLGDALINGPSAIVFSTLALVVHVFVLLFGSMAFMKFFMLKQLKNSINRIGILLPLGLEEVAIASNAAIGGPATAAAFAANLGGKKSRHIVNGRKRGLVMAATVWGVFGYAIGTSIGVKLTNILLQIL